MRQRLEWFKMAVGKSRREVVLGAVCMQCCHDKEVNLEKYEMFIRQAVDREVELLVFPEVSVQGFLTDKGDSSSPEALAQIDYYREEAETVPGPTSDRISRLAALHNMVIQFGMAEKNGPGTVLYNSAIVVGPSGVIGVSRKVHNQNDFPIFRSGNGFPVFDTPAGRIGPFICGDMNYPETLRALTLQGAVILTMSTAYPLAGRDIENDPFGEMYEIQAQAAAMANQVWVVQSNQVKRPPKEGARDYFGHSRIVSPFGKVVAACGYEESLVTASVDVYGQIQMNKRLCGDLIQRRRPELYGILTDLHY